MEVIVPYYDFAEIKRRVSITEAAELLKLTLKPERTQFRAACPTCGGDDPRAIVFTPEKQMFYCFKEKKGGDCIALVQHITGLDLQGSAEWLSELSGIASPPTVRATAPTKPEVRSQPSPAPNFDPTKFASKLVWSAEVEALGFTKEDAERLGVGYHSQRKLVFLPLRNPDASISGFVAIKGGQFVLPPKWLLPADSKVVQLRRA